MSYLRIYPFEKLANGKIKGLNKEMLRQAYEALPPGRYEHHIEAAEPYDTERLRKFYFGVVIPFALEIINESGDSKLPRDIQAEFLSAAKSSKDLHEKLKEEFNNGESTNMEPKDWIRYFNLINAFLSNSFGAVMPNTGEWKPKKKGVVKWVK